VARGLDVTGFFPASTLPFNQENRLPFLGTTGVENQLLRIIAMLTPLTTGRLKLFGQEPLNVKNSLRRKLSFLSHEKRLYSALSVAENMRLVANIQGIPGEALIDEALTQLNLMRHKQKKVRELSEGMRKRLVLARLVLRDAQLILLDEPYPSLDKESRQILDDLIKGWREDGKVILHASHDHDLALVHANRLLILEQGKLEYDGSPK
jgi:ABC-type multidrug transport system ATPase subunit